jgi:hypothetical protein
MTVTHAFDIAVALLGAGYRVTLQIDPAYQPIDTSKPLTEANADLRVPLDHLSVERLMALEQAVEAADARVEFIDTHEIRVIAR